MLPDLKSFLDNKSVQLDEYREANANMRHFSNMRVAILTICFAINGILFKSTLEQTSRLITYGFALLGICTAFYFLLFDTRITKFYLFYRGRAIELEWLLGMNLHKRYWPRHRINVTNATKVLYWTIALIWVVLIVCKENSW